MWPPTLPVARAVALVIVLGGCRGESTPRPAPGPDLAPDAPPVVAPAAIRTVAASDPGPPRDPGPRLPAGVARLGVGRIVQGEIADLAFAPDGRLVAASNALATDPETERTNHVAVWDPRTSERLTWMPVRDANALAIAGDDLIVGTQGGRVRRWTLSDPTERWSVEAGLAVADVAVEGDRVAVALREGDAAVLDAQGAVLTRVRAGAELDAVALRGDLLVTGGADPAARVWSLASGEAVALVGGGGGVGAVTVGRGVIVTGGWDGVVRAFTESGAPKRTFEGHTDEVTDLAISADGRVVASSSRDGTVRLWSLATGQPVATLGGGDPLTAVDLSADGALVAAGGRDRTVRVFDVASGFELGGDRHAAAILALRVTGDGRQVATLSADGTARLWDLPTGRELSRLELERDPRDGQLSRGGLRIAERHGDVVVVRQLETDEIAGRLPIEGVVPNGIRFSPDGLRLAWFDGEGRVRLVDVGTAAEVGAWSLAPDLATDVVVLGPETLLAVSPYALRVLDAPGTERVKVELPERYPFLEDAAPSPDRRLIAVRMADESVRVLDLATGAERSRRDDLAAAAAPAWSPDGRRLAVVRRGGFVLLDPATGVTMSAPTGPHARVRSLAFARDGRLVTGGEDGSVLVWSKEALERR